MHVKNQNPLMTLGRIVFTLTFTAAAIIAALAWSSKKAKADYPETIYCGILGRQIDTRSHKCERVRQRELRDDREYHESGYERSRRLERERTAERERERIRERERQYAREFERSRGKTVYGYIAGPASPEFDARRCPYSAVKVVGENAHSQQQAELNAERQWQQTVLWHSGERAMSIGNAMHKRMSCNQSAADPTGFFRKAAKKLVEGVTAGERSTLTVRCEFEAIPCNAPVGEVIDPVTERD